MLSKRPPTLAAKWMTCVGRYLSKISLVAAGSLLNAIVKISTPAYFLKFNYFKSPSFELKKMNSSSGLGFSRVTFWIALPTKPLPPVTKIIFFSDMVVCYCMDIRQPNAMEK